LNQAQRSSKIASRRISRLQRALLRRKGLTVAALSSLVFFLVFSLSERELLD
jgi:hypothetical protein